MVKVFQRFRQYKSYIDKNFPGRDWNIATSMVITGKAGMQFMGDWAKGEFFNAGQKAEKDFIAVPFPGTQDAFVFTTDSFMFFELKEEGAKQAQKDFAETILKDFFQESFNQSKGSIPVSLKVDPKSFDTYGKKSIQDFKASMTKNTLLPSMAHGMAADPAVKGAIEDVVTQFFNSNQLSPEKAALKLAKTVEKTISDKLK